MELCYLIRMLPLRTHPYLRLFALLLATFQVLAAGRALVPKLCLTQRDALAAEQARESAGAECNSHSCCANTKSDSGKPQPTRGGDNGRCAFCFISKALVEAPDIYSPVPLPQVADAPYEQGQGRSHRDLSIGLIPGRAPPTS